MRFRLLFTRVLRQVVKGLLRVTQVHLSLVNFLHSITQVLQYVVIALKLHHLTISLPLLASHVYLLFNAAFFNHVLNYVFIALKLHLHINFLPHLASHVYLLFTAVFFNHVLLPNLPTLNQYFIWYFFYYADEVFFIQAHYINHHFTILQLKPFGGFINY